MSLFKKIFGDDNTSSNGGGGSQKTALAGPDVQFGRYTDANKPESKYKEWDRAKALFNEKKYVESYDAFFSYLRDDAIGNASHQVEGDAVKFELSQGSKVIKGTATAEHVEAEVDIAQMEKNSVAVMRKLMNMNYGLQYSRFALRDNTISMKFTSYAIDASPNKMFYSLKELCTKADKQDDVLIDEFNQLKEVGTEHIIELSEQEREVKYKYLNKWISDTIEAASQFDEQKFDGAISYLLLALTYRIDYLLSPEGALMNYLEKINHTYFAKDNKSYIEKNRNMLEEYRKIVDKPKDEIANSFYNVKQCFGVVNAASHKQVADFIYKETPNTNWYKDNNYPQIVLAIYEYVCGYCLFNYGMYPASIELMNLFMHVVNHDYYSELGFPQKYRNEDGSLNGNAISDSIRVIIRNGKREFPNLDFKTQYLRFGNAHEFAETFIKEIDYLNFSKERT